MGPGIYLCRLTDDHRVIAVGFIRKIGRSVGPVAVEEEFGVLVDRRDGRLSIDDGDRDGSRRIVLMGIAFWKKFKTEKDETAAVEEKDDLDL